MKASAKYLGLLALLAGCSSAPPTLTYRAPGSEFSLEYPADWTPYGNLGTLQDRPLGYVMFMPGEPKRQGEDWSEPRISVYRLMKSREGLKIGDQDWADYRKEHLDPALDLFTRSLPQTSTMTVAGQKARLYWQKFLSVNRKGEEDAGVKMAIEQVVFLRQDAVFVLECRAKEEVLPNYLYAFRKLLDSFRFGP